MPGDDYKKFQKEAIAILKGKTNATGRKANVRNMNPLASALMKGNTAKRNEILGRFTLAQGAPAAAAVAAGVAVADVAAGAPAAPAAPAASSKITNANRGAAKEAINAALREAGTGKKVGVAAASKYAKLMKDGKGEEAEEYLASILAKAGAAGAKAAAGAAAKEATARLKAELPDNRIKAELAKYEVKAGPINIGAYRKAIAEGKTNKNAVNYVKANRTRRVEKSAATRAAKKNGAAGAAATAAVATPAAPIPAAANALLAAAAAAGPAKKATRNIGVNTRNLGFNRPKSARKSRRATRKNRRN